MAEFTVEANCSGSSARAASLCLNEKIIHTPVFMPVGTYGAVKTLLPNEISNAGYKLILANTYHMYLRPGLDVLKSCKGLHRFMNWKDLILTDSGGYQIFSLKGLRKIEPDGASFQSHIDGKTHKLTPKKIIDIQRVIGSDIMMMLDVCPSGDDSKRKWEKAVDLTTDWAKRGMDYYNSSSGIYDKEQLLVPIVQGGTNKELRKKSADQLMKLDAFMYAIGGLAVGEPKDEMLKTVSYMDKLLPKHSPRYLMGVGTPIDLIKNVSNGVDMFDCVMPTRNARNGQLFTKNGKINIRNSKYINDHNPIDLGSKSTLSRRFTRSYLHHLFKTKEVLGLRIATEHNLHFYFNLMKKIREEIINDNFVNWSNKFIKRYEKIDN